MATQDKDHSNQLEMKQEIETLASNVECLRAFAERYRPESGDGIRVMVHSISYWQTPEVSFNGHTAGVKSAIAYCAALFGADGWKKVHQTATSIWWKKMVDGVTVSIQDAEPVTNPQEGSPVDPALLEVAR